MEEMEFHDKSFSQIHDTLKGKEFKSFPCLWMMIKWDNRIICYDPSYDFPSPQFIKELSPWHNLDAVLRRLGIVFIAHENVP